MVSRGVELDGAYYETPYWEHGGNTMAFSSLFRVLPEQGFAISILSSGYGTDFTASADTAIRTLVDGLPAPADPPEYVVDTSRYAHHVGDYLDEWNVGQATVTQVGDSPRVDMPTLDEYDVEYDSDLIAISSDIHYIEIEGNYYDLTFIQQAEDQPSAYVRNRVFVLTRDDGQALTGQRRTPTKADVERFLARARTLEPGPGLPPR